MYSLVSDMLGLVKIHDSQDLRLIEVNKRNCYLF